MPPVYAKVYKIFFKIFLLFNYSCFSFSPITLSCPHNTHIESSPPLSLSLSPLYMLYLNFLERMKSNAMFNLQDSWRDISQVEDIKTSLDKCIVETFSLKYISKKWKYFDSACRFLIKLVATYVENFLYLRYFAYITDFRTIWKELFSPLFMRTQSQRG